MPDLVVHALSIITLVVLLGAAYTFGRWTQWRIDTKAIAHVYARHIDSRLALNRVVNAAARINDPVNFPEAEQELLWAARRANHVTETSEQP